MRESLCTAINAETDLKIVETSSLDVNAFQLTISHYHDVLFLAEKPDIILLALGTHGTKELEALSNLRRKLHIPILALTRDEVKGQEQQALKYGAYAVLTKTASRLEMLQALRSIRSNG